jgi:tRNA pseudouridine55 synthase
MPIITYKDIGETPLDVVNKYRENNIKYSFAGRLDPMARGEMIVLKGDECKTQDKYCGLDKIYEFEILYGFQTDTYDILGLIKNHNNIDIEKLSNNVLNIKKYEGNYEQEYPAYSSMIVNKQPLWWWAKNGKMDEITIPKKSINIYNIEYIKDINVSDNKELLELIENRILKLSPKNISNFRGELILENWRNILDKNKFKPIIKRFRAKVSSGTYIRSLVNRIGEDIGCFGIAFDINRTKIIFSNNLNPDKI